MREAARGSIMFFHLTRGSIFQTYLAYFNVGVTQTPHVLLCARAMSAMQLQDAQNEMFHPSDCGTWVAEKTGVIHVEEEEITNIDG